METFKNNKCNIKTMATKTGMERHVWFIAGSESLHKDEWILLKERGCAKSDTERHVTHGFDSMAGVNTQKGLCSGKRAANYTTQNVKLTRSWSGKQRKSVWLRILCRFQFLRNYQRLSRSQSSARECQQVREEVSHSGPLCVGAFVLLCFEGVVVGRNVLNAPSYQVPCLLPSIHH